MKKAAVLGYPISHSLSPKLHGYWLEKCQIKGSYEAIETKPEKLDETLSRLVKAGYSGVNLTVPLKEAVMPLLDEISPEARKIGAANTVIFSDGKMRGHNTDAYGFIENLKAGIEGELSDYLDQVVILGAGGAARAVIVGLLDEGAKKITLLNRTRKKAEMLAKIDTRIQVKDWEKRTESLSDASLLVNTTSLGMQKMPVLDISLSALPVNALVTDIVYHPLITPLLEQANQRGNLTVDGLGMLIHQAVPAFEMFFDQKPKIDERIRDELLI